MPSVMRLFGALGGIEDDELRATFNGGLGMIVVVAPDAVGSAIATPPRGRASPAWRVGEVAWPPASSAGSATSRAPIR